MIIMQHCIVMHNLSQQFKAHEYLWQGCSIIRNEVHGSSGRSSTLAEIYDSLMLIISTSLQQCGATMWCDIIILQHLFPSVIKKCYDWC